MARFLADLPLDPDEVDAFFAEAERLGWGDFIPAAREAAFKPEEEPTYLVLLLDRGMMHEHQYLPLPDAQLAVASHCDRDPTELYSSGALPWGAVYCAADETGDRDAWAFPVAASGYWLADLQARHSQVLTERAATVVQLHAALRQLHTSGLSGPPEPLTFTGCPYCGGEQYTRAAEDEDLLACQTCGRVWIPCPDCDEVDTLTYEVQHESTPTGIITAQRLNFQCGRCQKTWMDTWCALG